MSAGARTGDRTVAFFTAVVAVLAALGTLFSHHRSIVALSLRNQAVLATAQASDQYGYYQTKQLKITMYQTLLAVAPPADAAREKSLQSAIAEQQRSSIATYSRAKLLEAQGSELETRADGLLRSFETLEIATTLFEISIAFASIAALTHLRFTLWLGAGLSAIGIVIGIAGYVQVH